MADERLCRAGRPVHGGTGGPRRGVRPGRDGAGRSDRSCPRGRLEPPTRSSRHPRRRTPSSSAAFISTWPDASPPSPRCAASSTTRRPDKRQRLVEQLLAGPRYVTHFTNVWRALLLPETTASLQARFLAPGFEAWLHKKLQQNTPYDVLVRELLTAPMNGQGRNPFGQQGGEPTPIAFYLAKEVKPENLAAASARLFLGVKIECAQCHNHPFAEWKRDQFWSLRRLLRQPATAGKRRFRGRRPRGRRPPRADHPRHRARRAGRIPRRHAAEMEVQHQRPLHLGRVDDQQGQPLFRAGGGQPPVGLLLRHRHHRPGR